jgi:transposase
MIGLDLAKNTFQAHGAKADGSVAFRKKLRRDKVMMFFDSQPRCTVAMEACASAHFWARSLQELGHEVRLVPPRYVKPFVKRQKNDAADAEAIAEAASRPTMRFVAVKSEAKQAQGMAFKTRDLMVRQRTQMINALRGNLAEFGVIAPQGVANVERLRAVVDDDPDAGLPAPVVALAQMLLEQIDEVTKRIHAIEHDIKQLARQQDSSKRVMTIPGVGPICATAVEAFAPPMESFNSGRDFAAWLGLTPRQHSTGGKERLGKMSKMGQRDLRRLLIGGAMAVVRWAGRNGAPEGSWLARMLQRKPRMVVAVALANKNARIIWALLTRGGVYKDPAVAAA